MVNLNVRLDETEHTRLEQTCKGRGCDKSTVVREALRSYLGSGAQQAGTQTPAPRPAAAEPAITGFIDTPICPVSHKPFVMGRILTPEEEKKVLAQ